MNFAQITCLVYLAAGVVGPIVVVYPKVCVV